MKHTLTSTIIISLFVGMLSSMATGALTNYQKFKFCEYAQSFSRIQNDIMISQHAGANNLELIQCDGEAKVIRDDKNQVQNFTVYFPQGKYTVKTNDVAGVTNVIFLRAGDTLPDTSNAKAVPDQNIEIK